MSGAREGLVLPFLDARPACADADPELFFYAPGERGEDRAARDEKAKAVCAGCPLLRGCLGWALTHAEWGVWGGLTEQERYALQRRHGLTRRVGPYSGQWRVDDIDNPVPLENQE